MRVFTSCVLIQVNRQIKWSIDRTNERMITRVNKKTRSKCIVYDFKSCVNFCGKRNGKSPTTNSKNLYSTNYITPRIHCKSFNWRSSLLLDMKNIAHSRLVYKISTAYTHNASHRPSENLFGATAATYTFLGFSEFSTEISKCMMDRSMDWSLCSELQIDEMLAMMIDSH